jgi:hypothetical protein
MKSAESGKAYKAIYKNILYISISFVRGKRANKNGLLSVQRDELRNKLRNRIYTSKHCKSVLKSKLKSRVSKFNKPELYSGLKASKELVVFS